jgi:hypothetical protein
MCILKRRILPVALALLVALALIPATSGTAGAKPSPSDASMITDWNQIAVNTIVNDPPIMGHPQTLLYMGLFQAAVYDAVVGIEGRYEPYRFDQRAPHPSSAQAAAVAAAHELLVTYFSYNRATLDTDYASSLAQIPDGKAKTNGIAFGIRAADNLIALRAHDGRDAPILFTQPPAPGVWRPTLPAFVSMLDPWLGFVTPLLVKSAFQFAPPPPPTLTSLQYTTDFIESKAYGSATSTVRTPEQTATAQFFSTNPVVLFNAGMRDQVTVRNLDLVDAARMFAGADMSVADAIITVWRAKYDYGFWRPITAINLADTDGNPLTIADPTWGPLIPTPAYPEYPSGYNSFAASVTGSLEKMFHTRHLNLTLVSAAGVVRQYDTGAAVRADVVNARIWQGIHFRSADEASRNLGVALSQWVVDRYFQSDD